MGCSPSQAEPPLPWPVSLQAVSSQQGCQPRAGERRPWEPGAADLSPPFSTACFSSHTLRLAWPQGGFAVSCQVFTSDLGFITLWPGPPSLSWADARGLTWEKAGSTSLRVDFIEVEAGCVNPGSAWIWNMRPRRASLSHLK